MLKPRLPVFQCQLKRASCNGQLLTHAGRPVSPGTVNFSEGEVAHVEIYEETPEIRKEAFVREEVRVKKVVEQDTVEAQETIRREELDVNTGGQSIADASKQLPNDQFKHIQ